MTILLREESKIYYQTNKMTKKKTSEDDINFPLIQDSENIGEVETTNISNKYAKEIHP